MNSRHYTLETKGTTDAVFIRGPKKDIEKRQATLQLAIRVKGKQIVKPTLIMRNIQSQCLERNDFGKCFRDAKAHSQRNEEIKTR